MAAGKPGPSPITPPPKASRMESRSAPARTSWLARDSTAARRLWRSPRGRKRTDGWASAGKLARRGLRVDIGGVKKTKELMTAWIAGKSFKRILDGSRTVAGADHDGGTHVLWM